MYEGMIKHRMLGPNQQEILFSDYFKIDKSVLEEYGAFNISLLADLPLFIDPFLLFNNPKEEYQALHREIIRYLTFLRDKSIGKAVTPGLLKEWYRFKEVKQTWLGFSFEGNKGRGLGPKFARALDTNFYRLFSDEYERPITKGSHLEKLCLVQQGVGRDNISDFATNLIKEYLLSYTQEFAKLHLKPEQCRVRAVAKVRFNYTTESWETVSFTLPYFQHDFIILVPRDLLTREDTWINRTDLINSYELLPPAISNDGLRAQINNYFEMILPKNAKEKDRKEAAQEVIAQFPELIDYYIKLKEETGDEAVASSNEKVIYAESLFLENFTKLASLVANSTDFYQYGVTTLEDTLKRIECLQEAIEDNGGSQFLYNSDGKPVAIEGELKVAYRFIWFSSIDGTLKEQPEKPKNIVPVEFKLASNRNIEKFLDKKIDEAMKAETDGQSDLKPSVTVIFVFSGDDRTHIQEYIKNLQSSTYYIRVVDASKFPEDKSSEEGKGVSKPQSQPQKNPRVFISYSHDRDVWQQKNGDPETHRKRVFQLAERLRGEGVECIIDQHMANPPEGWPRWMMNQIEEADFVLVIGTETYDRRFRGKEAPDKGFGSQWEGAIITQELYEANGRNQKFIPVIFESSDARHIPLTLRNATHYNVTNDENYNELYYYLTNQPPYIPTALGPIRQRPPRSSN